MNEEIDSIQFRNVMKDNGEYLIRLAFFYVKDWSAAEDIVQEVFVTYFLKSHQFENRSSIRTYLAKITVNKCHDYLRSWKNKIHLYSNQLFGNSGSKKNSPEQIIIDKNKNDLLIQEVLKMSIKYRDVILLYYYQEFTIIEISKILNCSENTVKTRLSRAKSILKNNLDGTEWEVILNEQS
ncbi:sigma-70 family RNA polymerase sigma factor [Bacillus sp. EB01]|uniref:sigma-70 family RNA polymerase sigma factor n=1 Tax=Bacillus sp. EB01 TaxID=1347086 RepID=UPI0005C78A9D|nr:sigma-70 family RNA polymerase sigma factor [Bacillus sp. EB01]